MTKQVMVMSCGMLVCEPRFTCQGNNLWQVLPNTKTLKGGDKNNILALDVKVKSNDILYFSYCQ